jgi:hypothetical protein
MRCVQDLICATKLKPSLRWCCILITASCCCFALIIIFDGACEFAARAGSGDTRNWHFEEEWVWFGMHQTLQHHSHSLRWWSISQEVDMLKAHARALAQ